ncbi:xaa-Pro aminopeptidase ApepP [Plutella xylostella]|uniref:xaa-Pro aminopeptidase ApepP n=1 Tax=Plutella xylostella TaxID=51655 RepID=UPI0020324159|nr:xaa-Pro aminopeptidase ApepP [Plutella xylostella]
MAVFWEHFLLLCVLPASLVAHIPDSSYSYYGWSEAGYALPTSRLDNAESAKRLMALRDVMSVNNIDAYVIPTADAHQSTYIAPSDARREWISGLSGSSGTAVVTSSEALVWTDGRYYTQFEIQVDQQLWTLMKQVNATIPQWLSTLPAGSVVGIDPSTYTRTEWTSLEATLAKSQITLTATPANLVDVARTNIDDPPPPRPNYPLLPLGVEYTGRRASEKISDLVSQIRDKGAKALVITALDEVAYTLNLRGSDIPYNPVFFAYLIIRVDITTDNVILFWGQGELALDVVQHLATEGVSVLVRPYRDVFEYLDVYTGTLAEGSTIWLSKDSSHEIFIAAEHDGKIKTEATISPVALMKIVKNEVELEGFTTAHIKDGVAVVRALRWAETQVRAGVQVTEVELSDKLDEMRAEESDYMGPSFATIVGAGANGAIIHYKPSREGEQTVIKPDDMLLVDSGGQYKQGTTDITRTRHLATPTEQQRLAFTLVLKGQIMLATAVFPRGLTGTAVESFARVHLWRRGLDYAHGTGHGVGHFLNVHEGPNRINAAPRDDPGVQPGMVYSNEPGYYEVGEYGIRHEDLMVSIEMNKDVEHIYADQMRGDFAGRGAVAFHTISLAPHQTSSLDVSLLTDEEIKYLNDYHARVLSTLGPILQSRNLSEDYQWLVSECAPITNAAILLTATPLLLLAALCLWF